MNPFLNFFLSPLEYLYNHLITELKIIIINILTILGMGGVPYITD